MLHKRRGVTLVVGMFVLTTALMLPTSGAANAVDVPDQVLAWNQNAYNELIVTAAQAPPVAVMHLAMVHGAVYDAVNAIDGGYEPYLVSPSATGTESKDAAASAAAYQVLLSVLPADRDDELLGYYNTSLGLIPDGAAEDEGVEIGNAAAAAMILARTGDGRFGDQFFTEGAGPGDWRNIAGPLNPAGNNFKWVGDVTPFLVPDASAFATPGPLPLGSAAYAAEFQQVKSLGRATNSTRTADQTAMAQFWADHAVAMWTRIFRQVSVNEQLSVTDNARYFAMLYLTGSDAAIACFQDKERYSFWRPQTAIQLAGIDGNPGTVADPTWTSLLGNPPYSDHPSGHNCVSNSFVQTLKDFFGTNQMSFSATRATSPIGPITRSFTHFSHAANEVRRARVYGGLHFMTADAQGATLGRKIADWRQDHYFQPVA
jgi:hypothetical protein